MFYNVNDMELPGTGTTSYRLCGFVTSTGTEEPINSMYGAGFRFRRLHKQKKERRDIWYHIAGQDVKEFRSINECVNEYSGLTAEDPRRKDKIYDDIMIADLLVYRKICIDLV